MKFHLFLNIVANDASVLSMFILTQCSILDVFNTSKMDFQQNSKNVTYKSRNKFEE